MACGAECADECGHVALLLAGGYEAFVFSNWMFGHDAVVVVEVGTPVHHLHAFLACLAALERLLYELFAEEEHVVDAAVEHLCHHLAQTAVGLHYGLMMPQDDGVAVEVECAQEYDEFEAIPVGGIDGVDMLTACEHTPCHIYHEVCAALYVLVFVHHHIDAVALEVGGSVEEMARKLTCLPLFVDALQVLSMVKINFHFLPNRYFLNNGLTRSMLDMMIQKPMTSRATTTDSVTSMTKLRLLTLMKSPTILRLGSSRKWMR